MITLETKWIVAKEVTEPKTLKTKIFQVWAKDPSFLLGEVRWYNRFRKYSFMPAANTVFEQDCMQAITDFLKKLQAERNG
jgi:hypothetical protein